MVTKITQRECWHKAFAGFHLFVDPDAQLHGINIIFWHITSIPRHYLPFCVFQMQTIIVECIDKCVIREAILFEDHLGIFESFGELCMVIKIQRECWYKAFAGFFTSSLTQMFRLMG